MMTRVLIVDDHPFFRSCLVDLINASDDLDAVGECADGADAVATAAVLQPDVVLMDVRMAGISGIEAVGVLQQRVPSARVLMLTSDAAESSRRAARAGGAVGYLVKGCDGDVVVAAVRHVAAGGTVWPESQDGSVPDHV